MRNYLIDEDKNELIIDLVRSVRHEYDLIEFEYSTLAKDQKVLNKQKVFVRKLAGCYFSSRDQIYWKKAVAQEGRPRMSYINRVFDLYFGYRPSGLGGGNEGELFTQMPGKVVKINVAVGDCVRKGATLLVLEAMKMENEIKSSLEGVVKKIHCQEGDTLDSGVLMLELNSNNNEEKK